MWTVTLEVHTDLIGAEETHRALEDLLRSFGMCHVTVGYDDDRYVARFCVGGDDEPDAEMNAMALWQYAVERVGLTSWPLTVFEATADPPPDHVVRSLVANTEA